MSYPYVPIFTRNIILGASHALYAGVSTNLEDRIAPIGWHGNCGVGNGRISQEACSVQISAARYHTSMRHETIGAESLNYVDISNTESGAFAPTKVKDVDQNHRTRSQKTSASLSPKNIPFVPVRRYLDSWKNTVPFSSVLLLPAGNGMRPSMRHAGSSKVKSQSPFYPANYGVHRPVANPVRHSGRDHPVYRPMQ